MDQSQLALASALHELTKQQDGISNNLSNVNSVAFKRRAGSFAPFEITLDKAARRAGAQVTSTTIPRYTESSDFQQGDFQQTDDDRNIALTGPGFLAVQVGNDPNRILYTRDGVLSVSPDGNLTTRNGYTVLSRAGTPINVGPARFRVTSSGDITDKTTGAELGNIGIVKFDKPGKLRPLGQGLFVSTQEAGQAQPDRFTKVTQGGIERSNVDSIQELVSMISVQRHFQVVSRAMTTVEAINQQLVQLARG